MFKNKKCLIRHYLIHYKNEDLLPYPEHTINKLGLSEDKLNGLKTLNNRKRSEVINWMKELDIELSTWAYVGW